MRFGSVRLSLIDRRRECVPAVVANCCHLTRPAVARSGCGVRFDLRSERTRITKLRAPGATIPEIARVELRGDYFDLREAADIPHLSRPVRHQKWLLVQFRDLRGDGHKRGNDVQYPDPLGTIWLVAQCEGGGGGAASWPAATLSIYHGRFAGARESRRDNDAAHGTRFGSSITGKQDAQVRAIRDRHCRTGALS